ncbi:hypothetical protein C8A05DRAFT_31871 [Staphylotrichum tortipilum]|uniref:Putative gamma-glutamylcyclotransferase n=1 Tax=Staphylotrichum tortipilum TaxID=2831512 RepID=A0AAN6MQ10_9PEZI|nr:hypothetical protein C8A05DRAFT_31871 [Staphylotrichum longicolle]
MADSETTKGNASKATPASPATAKASTRTGFQPRTLFFYGSLMDPEVLARVARLWRQTPLLEDAWIEGFELKLWGGKYPVVLPTTGTATAATDAKDGDADASSDGTAATAPPRVHGKAWLTTSQNQLDWLQYYETDAYEPVECEVHVGKEGEGEGEMRKGWAFKWSGVRPVGELVEGTWDLEEWRRTRKGSVLR